MDPVKTLLDLMTSVRPNGIEPDAYPMIVEMVYNYALLQLTGVERKDG